MLIKTLSCANVIFRNNHPELFLEKGVLKICCKFTREHLSRNCFATLLKSHFRMGVLLYWNHTLAWVFFCKFAAYFQNTSYLLVAASEYL